MSKNDELVLFSSRDGEVILPVEMDGDTVWLSQTRMATLFGTSKQNISLHANNCFKEGELESLAVVKDGKCYKVKVYSLDVIISVGYRVKSQRGVEFRRWATNLKKFLTGFLFAVLKCASQLNTSNR